MRTAAQYSEKYQKWLNFQQNQNNAKRYKNADDDLNLTLLFAHDLSPEEKGQAFEYLNTQPYGLSDKPFIKQLSIENAAYAGQKLLLEASENNPSLHKKKRVELYNSLVRKLRPTSKNWEAFHSERYIEDQLYSERIADIGQKLVPELSHIIFQDISTMTVKAELGERANNHAIRIIARNASRFLNEKQKKLAFSRIKDTAQTCLKKSWSGNRYQQAVNLVTQLRDELNPSLDDMVLFDICVQLHCGGTARHRHKDDNIHAEAESGINILRKSAEELLKVEDFSGAYKRIKELAMIEYGHMRQKSSKEKIKIDLTNAARVFLNQADAENEIEFIEKLSL